MKISSSLVVTLFAFILLPISGCKTAAEHHDSLHSTQEKNMTVGVVQKEIKKGMSQAAVAEALGSPNMVTRDKDETETWIYDKVSTDVSYSASSGGLLIGALGGSSNAGVGGFGGASYGSGAGAASRTQRTLTVIIKFKEGVVNEYTYNASKF